MIDQPPAWSPPAIPVVRGGAVQVRHIWCIGRNYAEHAREMGADPRRFEPVFFSKPAAAMGCFDAVAWPPATGTLHHEVELVLFLAAGGHRVPAADWPGRIGGFAVGVDLTRRDVQARLKAAAHPWDISKGFDRSAPVGWIRPAAEWQPDARLAIELRVNGALRQQARLGDMIWSVPELLARLSAELTLNAGDAVFTGTPAGVGALQPGDRVQARIEGLPELEFAIQRD